MSEKTIYETDLSVPECSTKRLADFISDFILEDLDGMEIRAGSAREDGSDVIYPAVLIGIGGRQHLMFLFELTILAATLVAVTKSMVDAPAKLINKTEAFQRGLDMLIMEMEKAREKPQ